MTINRVQQRSGMTLLQALEEANRCLLCHDAPCSAACPGGTDPGAFIRKIRFLNLKGAAAVAMRNNPLAGSCAMLCPTESTCQGACTRQGMDRPINIPALQSFAVDYGVACGLKATERAASTGRKIAVIGSGPAGMTAAAKLAEYGHDVTLFEAKAEAGGMLRYGVPDSRLPKAILDRELADLERLGVKLELNTQVGDSSALLGKFDAVFMAPGLGLGIQLKMPGSDLSGVTSAVLFLEAAHNDAAALKAQVAGKNVAVIGGGSVAMDVARVSRELGAKRIYVLSLEAMDELPAAKDELEHAQADGVIFHPQSRTVEIVGADGKVVGLKGIETEWAIPGNLSPSNAKDIEGTEFNLKIGMVIQAVGQTVTTETKALLGEVDWFGRSVTVTQDQATSVQKIYAGGDISRGPGTAIEAVGDGKRAADAIHNLLMSEGTL